MLTESQPVAQIVLDHSECAAVLQRHHIDYCCRGEQPLAEACRQRGLDPAGVLTELERAVEARVPEPADEPQRLATPQLIDRIVRRHHRYLRYALPFLVPLAKKVARVHGPHNPNLLDVRDHLVELCEVLLPHLDHEEEGLFPSLQGSVGPAIRSELRAMQADHLEVAKLLERIRGAAHDYALPDWACASYTTLMRELTALEADVFEHVHLENHVLLPRFAR